MLGVCESAGITFSRYKTIILGGESSEQALE